MPITTPEEQPLWRAIYIARDLLDNVAIGEMNGTSSSLYFLRLQALCELKGCELADLTLREITSCRTAADLEYNDQFPILFPGHQARPTAEVLANNPQGALV